MKFSLKSLLCLIVMSIIAAGCTSTKSKSDKKAVTVTILPQKFFAERIAGDKFRINVMVPQGSSPETFDPTPSDLVRLGESVAYFRIGNIGFERAWMDKLAANNPDMKIYNDLENIIVFQGGHHCHEHHSHEGECSDEAESMDPHIWTTPHNAAIIASEMLKAFIELDPENEEFFTQNYKNLIADIDSVDLRIKEALKDIPSRSFVIYHPSLTYFALNYGLEQHSIENNGKEPSAADLKAMIDKARESGARVIFIQQEFDRKNALIVAQEIGAKVVEINPLSYDWSGEMINIAESLK